MAASAQLRGAGNWAGDWLIYDFLEVEFSKVKASKVGVGGIPSPELGSSPGIGGTSS